MKYDFFHFANFGVDQPFCYVVCEHLHNVDEGASYLSLFCYRPVSLTRTTFSHRRPEQFETKYHFFLYSLIFRNFLYFQSVEYAWIS